MPPKSRTAVFECTSAICNQRIKSTFEANLHPLIGTLICRKCYKAYGTGDFASLDEGVDEHGDDNYCRWCCDGGDLYGCTNENGANNDRCHYSFCRDCITKNVPEDPILSTQTASWLCYACEPEKVRKLKEAAEAAMKELNERAFSKKAKEPAPKLKEPVKENTKEPLEDSPVKEKPNDSSTKEKAKEPPSKEKQKEPVSKEKQKEPVSKEKQREPAPKEKQKEHVSKEKQKEPASKEKQKEPETNKQREKEKEKPIYEPKDAPEDKLSQSDKSKVSQKKRKLGDEQPEVAKEIFTAHAKPLSENQTIKPVPEKQATRIISLSKEDLGKRLDQYRKISQTCVREIDTRFNILLEMFTSKEVNNLKRRKLIEVEIDNMQVPLQEYQTFLTQLRNLSNSI